MKFEERQFTDMYCQIKCPKCGLWVPETTLEPANSPLITMHMLHFKGTARCDHCGHEFPIKVEYQPYCYSVGVE